MSSANSKRVVHYVWRGMARAARRCMLMLIVSLFAGAIPSAAWAATLETEIPVQKSETSESASINIAIRVERHQVSLVRHAPPVRHPGRLRLIEPEVCAYSHSGHRLPNGLTAPLRR